MRRRWALGALSVALAALGGLGSAAPATAESVAYVQNHEVWQSSLDGSVKRRLSGGEGEWREVAAADSGNVVGIRREPEKIPQLSSFAVWDASGRQVASGPLPYRLGWFTYAYPLSLDLTADGSVLVYGFANFSFGYTSSAHGTYVTNITNTGGLEPIEVPDYSFPTTAGRRIVGRVGTTVGVQTQASAPYGPDFAPWLDVAGVEGEPELQRTDVAADGRTAAIEFDYPGQDKIGVVSVDGLGGEATGATECLLPTSGSAESVSLSADGSHIAWIDEAGLEVAGRPSGASGTCAFSSPPVTIATGVETIGTAASIGGATLPTSTLAGGGGGGGGGSADGGSSALSAPKKATASALAGKGILLTVRVPGKAKVVATGTVRASLLGLRGHKQALAARGSARPGNSGAAKIRLRATKRAMSRLDALRGATLRVTVVQGKFRKTARILLR
jgi:hypothetical protein